MQFPKGFSSDNASGVHPLIMDALVRANVGHTPAYGNDPLTLELEKKIKSIFGEGATAFPVVSGTGANTLALMTMTSSFNAIFCADVAHIYEDEAGAPEKLTGCKLIPLLSRDGKISTASMKPYLAWKGDMHRSQPSVISISQPTEFGTLYTKSEIKELAKFAHDNGMLLHVDGARISNAVVALGTTFKELITDTGVDVLSLGGTKNGLMYGELVVFLKSELAVNFKFLRKHALQLVSKMRFVSAQFLAYFEKDLWKSNAAHANKMASDLAYGLKKIPLVEITHPVQVNVVFATLPKSAITTLQKQFPFYVWNEESNLVRWMCSFDTTSAEVDAFVKAISSVL